MHCSSCSHPEHETHLRDFMSTMPSTLFGIECCRVYNNKLMLARGKYCVCLQEKLNRFTESQIRFSKLTKCYRFLCKAYLKACHSSMINPNTHLHFLPNYLYIGSRDWVRVQGKGQGIGQGTGMTAIVSDISGIPLHYTGALGISRYSAQYCWIELWLDELVDILTDNYTTNNVKKIEIVYHTINILYLVWIKTCTVLINI